MSSAYNSRCVTTFAYYWTTAGVRTISCRRKFVNVNNGRSNSTAIFRLKQRKQPLVSFLTGKKSAKTDRVWWNNSKFGWGNESNTAGPSEAVFGSRSNSTVFFRLKQRKKPLVRIFLSKQTELVILKNLFSRHLKNTLRSYISHFQQKMIGTKDYGHTVLLSTCTGILETWRKIQFELVKINSLFSN